MLRSLSSAGVRRLSSLKRANLLLFSGNSLVGRDLGGLPRESVPLFTSSNYASELTPWDQFKGSLFSRSFSSDLSPLPSISDADVEAAFKDLMAASWDEIPHAVVLDAKNALSKNTEDKKGQEALTNVFRAAEASVEFGAMLVQLRMSLDDIIGIVGENTQKVPDALLDALDAAYNRYMTYLSAFTPEETYLRKKVEVELGTKMVHLKMRCSGLGAQWGKVSILGTSGLSGSYVEQRAR